MRLQPRLQLRAKTPVSIATVQIWRPPRVHRPAMCSYQGSPRVRNVTRPLAVRACSVSRVISITSTTCAGRSNGYCVAPSPPGSGQEIQKPLCAASSGVCPPAPPAGGHAAPTALPVHPAQRGSPASVPKRKAERGTARPPGAGRTPQDGVGEETARGGAARGVRDFKRSEVSSAHETHLRCTHVAPEATRDGVG